VRELEDSYDPPWVPVAVVEPVCWILPPLAVVEPVYCTEPEGETAVEPLLYVPEVWPWVDDTAVLPPELPAAE